ncbi:MAG TPA: hypothetical protein VGR07_03160 [Thermoanaerobaculia bacterium]|nr:hypothetical protein [Thermoanaerobaculia bacterium]
MVVVDDVSRFACHVFQYLSEAIGFGIGQVPDDGGRESPPFVPGKPLRTPSGHANVWWINAGARDWRAQLIAVAARVKDREARFLVDVRGPLRAHLNGYDVQEVIQLLLQVERKSEEIVPVSSYRTGHLKIAAEERPIRPKTWKVLQEIADMLAISAPPLEGLHILVTGAGFELAGSLGGCQGLGMPKTSDILLQGWLRYGNGQGTILSGQGFPIPEQLLKMGGDSEGLRRAARDGDLDAYWNEALKLILEGTPGGLSSGDPRERKSAASRQEHQAREDFRHSFLRYDWGQLNQALDAASLPWTAWLSTNYTGFADRALALHERDLPNGREKVPEHWSIVSTSLEAVHLTRRLLHGDHPQGRILFKLHGDIEHLLTMAVAGQDKEIYSTLSLPVDSLHEVYGAAELYLKRHLDQQKAPVFWHVVGHQMKDALLEGLLLRVCESTSTLRHHFLFVRPGISEGEHRERFSGPGSAWPVVSVPTCADRYLARLCRLGMSSDQWSDLTGWAQLMTGEQA